MVIEKTKLFQIFADGVGTAGADSGTTGDNDASAAGMQNSANNAPDFPQHNVPWEDVSKEYAAEIEAMYNDRYSAEKSKAQADFQKALNARMKKANDEIAKYSELDEGLAVLCQEYKVKEGDYKALKDAILNDDRRYEERSLETGESVETLKANDKRDRELANANRRIAEMERAEKEKKDYENFQHLMSEAEELKKIYKDFDLQNELDDPNFAFLLNTQMYSLKDVYEMAHKDTLLPNAISYAVNRGAEQVAKSVAANGKRPVENGIGGASAATTKIDVAHMTKEQRQDIIKRKLRGEDVGL